MESSSDFCEDSSCLLQLPTEKMIEIQLMAVQQLWINRYKSNKCQLRRMDSVQDFLSKNGQAISQRRM